MNDFPELWQRTMFEAIRDGDIAEALKDAAMRSRLGEWTRLITAVTVRSFEHMGFVASAKGHRLEALPVSRSEYLSLDVVAFSAGQAGWSFPVAAIELENRCPLNEPFNYPHLWPG